MRGRILAWPFLMAHSQEEIDALHDAAVDAAVNGEVFTSASVDGMSFSQSDKAAFDAIDRHERRTAARTRGVLPIGMTKFISRGLQ